VFVSHAVFYVDFTYITCAIGVKGDNITISGDFLNGSSLLQNDGRVAFAIAFYGCCDACDACDARAYDDNFDTEYRLQGGVGR
jgi:hypothetical protein